MKVIRFCSYPTVCQYFISLIWILFAFATHTNGKESPNLNNDYLLIINTHTSDSPWSNAIIEPVQKWISTERNIAVFTEHLNMLIIKDFKELDAVATAILDQYSDTSPKGILLLGTPALLLKDRIRECWGDIPMILCAEEDYFGPDTVYIHKRPIPQKERIPLSTLAAKYNLTFLQTKLFLQDNVDLLHRMIPGLNEVLLIGDGRYTSQQLDYDMGTLMAHTYPGLKYRFISATDTSLEKLISLLNEVNPDSTGVLFSSWFRRWDVLGTPILNANSYRVIGNLSVPVFSLKSSVMNNSGIVGGCFYDPWAYQEHLKKTILAVLAGTPSRDIPFYIPKKSIPIFNYPSFLMRGLSVESAPSESIFQERPLTFFEEYKYLFAGVLIVVLLFFAFMYYRIRTLRILNHAQQIQFETSSELANLFDNMPIAFMKGKLLRNASQEVVDMEIWRTNECFAKSFVHDTNSNYFRASELFGNDLNLFLHFAELADVEKKAITYTQYFAKQGFFQNIVVTPATREGYVNAYYIDATELYNAQQLLNDTNQKLTMALNVANVVPWSWDLRKHTIFCDVKRALEQDDKAHYINEEKLLVPDTEYFSKIYKKDRKKVEQAYNNLITGITPKIHEEYRIVTHEKNGYKLDWVEIQAVVEKRDTDGTPLTLIGSSMIVTQRKKMEQELIEARNKAEESNQLKSAFLANMSHEIRTPLNAIVGFSSLLNATEDDEEREEYVKIIESNNELLLQLIGDILDLSKIEAGIMEFADSPVDVNSLLEELTKTLSLRAETKGLTIEFKDRLPECNILIDHNRLNQVLINLVTNAIKFTEEGGITIGYSLQKDGLLRFYVTDTGFGIAPDKQADVFTRFVKLNSFIQGSGLGLSICKTIVERMGGQIGLESEPGKGSTFWFTIRNIPTKKKQKQIQEHSFNTVAKNQVTILIAEDNESNFKLSETILKKDYRLLHAWNGEEAVELFKTHKPNIVLMDINMPVKNGYEATKEIRKISADVPILAVTAHAYASDEQDILSHGFNGYAAKPVNSNVLQTKIIDLLNTK